MNENRVATELHGTRTLQRQEPDGAPQTKFLGERPNQTDQTPAAKRRNTLAPDVSPGYAAENGTESRRDGRGSNPPAEIFRSLPAPDQRHNSTLALQFSAAVDSKISIVGNAFTSICTNLEIATAPTVASNPPNHTPWNERPSLCI